MMELRLPTLEQLRTVYDADLLKAFPAAELKPLRNMEELWEVDRYRPWCLFDGDEIRGRMLFVAGPSRLGAAGLSVRFPPASATRGWGRPSCGNAGGRTGHCNFRGK